MKAAPVRLHMRHRWCGWRGEDAIEMEAACARPERAAGQFVFETPGGEQLAHPRDSRSLSSHLNGRLRPGAVHTALLHELPTPDGLKNPAVLAQRIGALPRTLTAPRPAAEAISTAGGVRQRLADD